MLDAFFSMSASRLSSQPFHVCSRTCLILVLKSGVQLSLMLSMQSCIQITPGQILLPLVYRI